MAYIINEKCLGEMDGSCVDVCPVDSIYEGKLRRYINPNECIDCGACLTACPVSAILGPNDDPDPAWVEDNRAFFALPLPTRTEPIGDPGGGTILGPVETDTQFTIDWAAGQ